MSTNTDVILPNHELDSKDKTLSSSEDTVDRERPKMTREGTFTKDSPLPNTDGDQQQEVTTNGSNHALLDKVGNLTS